MTDLAKARLDRQAAALQSERRRMESDRAEARQRLTDLEERALMMEQVEKDMAA